jgi:hypothetical protein
MPRSTVVIISGTTWTVPKSWNNSNNSVSCIGGGGGGGANTIGVAAGGGGGGARAISNNISLTIGNSIPVSIGAGGGIASLGGDTSFNSGTVLAKGGSGGANTGVGGAGGSATNSTGTTKWNGGNGASVAHTSGGSYGGGGGAGGDTAAGGNGSGRTSGAGGATGGAASVTSTGVDAPRGLFYGTNYAGSGGVGAKSRDAGDDGNPDTYYPGGSGGLFGAGGGATAIISAGQSDGSNYGEGAQGAIIVSWEWTPVALPASGSIGMSNVNLALGFPSTLSNSLDDLSVRTLLSVPSGQISMSSGYGLSSSKFGVIAGGFTTVSTALTSKYYYATDATTTGTNLTLVRHAMGAAGSGNETRAIFFAGANNTVSPIATTAKYTYSGDAVAAGATITTAANYGSATGTTTDGYFAGGATNLGAPGTFTTRHDKYTYSSDTRSVAAALGTARWLHSSITDKSTVAIHAGGLTTLTNYVATTEKYTYSSNTIAAGTALTNPKGWSVGLGNSTVGLITMGVQTVGDNSSTYKYTYSGDTVSSGTTITTFRFGCASITSNVAGIVAYGQSNNFWVSPLSVAQIYRYSNETVATGSNLSFPRLQSTGTGVTGSYFS